MKFKLVGIGEILWNLLSDGRQLGDAPATSPITPARAADAAACFFLGSLVSTRRLPHEGRGYHRCRDSFTAAMTLRPARRVGA